VPATPAQLLTVSLVAAAGSVVNSIAGGGTLLTFPALVGLHIPPLVANATSTVALVPGALGSLAGYREEVAGARSWVVRFAAPSVLGGLTGAYLLLITPAARFDALVPWLVLGATLLFMARGPAMRLAAWHRARAARSAPGPAVAREAADAGALPPPRWPLLLFQFFVAVYGGYFGAGIGILMLAALGFMGLTNIHQMNGLKNWGGACTNFVAALAFAASSIVDWPVALAMAAGAVVGGYGGSRLAQRVGQTIVRRAVVCIGLASAVWLFATR